MTKVACKACGYGAGQFDFKVTLNGDVGCSRCGCEYCGHSMIWDSPNCLNQIVSMWHGTCRNCGRDSLHETCRKSVGKRVRFNGTNGDEYDKENHGKSVGGEGLCLEYHDSHGLCIIVETDQCKRLCVDPISLTILED